ncbi:unnamed protein product [Peronospora destructor]|uniref:Polymerase nucleotidyl transferase domain-containing protein n=1 Tax=Peronospora destructor TaxID=86335 RepID=A0AAV0TK44_9STRA|nr:unnamed protein product [Peronospora destructor]
MKTDKLQQQGAAFNKSKKKKKKKKKRQPRMNLLTTLTSNHSTNEDTRLLRSGIDQYRTLQQLNTTSSSTTRWSRGSVDGAMERGISLMEKKQFGAAVPYFTEALDVLTSTTSPEVGTSSSTVKLYHQRGLCYLASHKYKCAIEDLSRVMHMTPKSAELYAKRGKAYAALGEHRAALLDYNEAINLAATQGAKVYKAMNNITHALNDLSQAESSAGGHRDLELFYERAHLYLQCHQESLALQDFNRFLELQEEAEEGRHFDASGGVGGLAGFVAPLELETAPKARMLDVLLERAKLQQRMALEEDARERKDVELATVEQGLSMQNSIMRGLKTSAYTSVPPKPEPYRGIESRRLEKCALRDYSRALKLDSSNAETFRLRGESLVHLARYEDALVDFASAFELDPHDFQVRMGRAQLFRQRGDLKGAVEEVTAVLRVNGFFINGLKLRAQLYEELGAIKEAEEDYSSIVHAHFDKTGIEDAASAGKVTMELASGGTLNLGGHGGKPSQLSGKNAKTGGSGKITSEVAAQALLCRARLRLAGEQFDAAEEDYQTILNSFANNMEAQLELQETCERKAAFEERKQREALAWLEQNADDIDGAGVLNANGNASSGKNKKKKKKKKKKSSSSNAVATGTNGKLLVGYVLLEDEEELLRQQEKEEQKQIQQELAHEKLLQSREPKQTQSQEVRSEMKTMERKKQSSSVILKERPEYERDCQSVAAETSVNDETIGQHRTELVATMLCSGDVMLEKSDEAQLRKMSSKSLQNVGESTTRVITTPLDVVVANVMTRDEAWESMWDEEADEPLEPGAVRIQIRAHSRDVAEDEVQTENETPTVNDVSLDKHKKIGQLNDEDHTSTSTIVDPTPSNADDEANDEASGSSDDGKDSQGKAKGVLVDEKYLKKREKQLKKLRTCLQHASDERDKSAIDEALARAERKQMSDALQDDIQRARDVLVDLAAEAQRLRETLPARSSPSSTSGSGLGRMHLFPVTPTTSQSNANPGKLPSLVIRPIAYGQALQAAEQHQQELRAHQKLLEEKDAEIARLKSLLAQNEPCQNIPAPQEEVRRVEARANAKAAALARRVIRLRTQFPVQSAAARQAEALVEWMGPSDAADRVRQQVLSFVQRVIVAHFPLAAAPLFFATGSYPMKTYLPGSDLDVCLLVPQELESSWYYIVTQALCVAGGSGGVGTVLDIGTVGGALDGGSNSSPSGPAVGSVSGPLLMTNTVRNVTFVNADVRVVKCTIDNIPVDFTANRLGALGAVRLLDAMAVRVGRQHLLKKSLILIKAWCTHESSPYMQAASAETGGLGLSVVSGSTPSTVMGASHGALSTYAVNTIVMALFNQYGDALAHPLQALYLFLDRVAEFPWHELALTLHGAVPLNRLATTPLNGTTSSKRDCNSAKLDAGDVEAIRDALDDQFGAFDAALKSRRGATTGLFPIRACNIVDPLDDKNNLARSVSAEGFPVVKRAFRLARDQLAAMLAPRSSRKDDDTELLGDETGSDVGMAFFVRCWQLYGRGDGWRPDLLIHPRQIWHGKAASKKNKASPQPRAASVSPVADNDDDEDRRWESLLPSLDAGAVNALLLQQQQLQQQAAAAAYHHDTMIAYQQPYYGPSPQQHGLPTNLPEGGPGQASELMTVPSGENADPQLEELLS